MTIAVPLPPAIIASATRLPVMGSMAAFGPRRASDLGIVTFSA